MVDAATECCGRRAWPRAICTPTPSTALRRRSLRNRCAHELAASVSTDASRWSPAQPAESAGPIAEEFRPGSAKARGCRFRRSRSPARAATPTAAEAVARQTSAALRSPRISPRPERPSGAVHLALERFGALDIVVEQCRGPARRSHLQGKRDDWERVIQTNLTGAFATLAAATPVMREAAEAGPCAGTHREHDLHRRSVRQLRPGGLCGGQGRTGRAYACGGDGHGALQGPLQCGGALRRHPRHRVDSAGQRCTSCLQEPAR